MSEYCEGLSLNFVWETINKTIRENKIISGTGLAMLYYSYANPSKFTLITNYVDSVKIGEIKAY